MKVFILLATLFSLPAFALQFKQSQIVTNGDMSAASIVSPGVDFSYIPTGSIQARWTGSPVGTLKVQVSNDIVASQNLVTNWSDFTGSAFAVNGAADVMYNIGNAGYRWVRLVYTKTSGTGTLNAIIASKGDY